MRILVCLTVALLLPTAARAQGAKPFRYQPGKHKQGELKYVNGIPVLVLRGSPAEMGEQTGVLAVRQAKPLFDFPRDYFRAESAREILRANPTWTVKDDAFKGAMAAAELFVWPKLQKTAAGLEKNFPDAHRAELKAITDHAGGVVGHDRLVAGNGLFDLGHVPQGGCSSAIIPPQLSATKGLLFGRNLDFPHFGYLHQYSLLMVYRSDDPKKRSFASAGFPGFVGSFTGTNDAGLTVASHEVIEPDTTTLFDPKGVPFAMAYRRVLEECATVGDALKLLDGMDRASITSLVIADPTGGAVIEVTPDSLAIRRFKDKPGVCTNHFCTMKSANQKDAYATVTRFKTLEKSVAVTTDGGFGVNGVQEWMHAVRLFDDDRADMTIQTFVFEPATRTVHLRFGDGNGPATKGKLATLDLTALWGK